MTSYRENPYEMKMNSNIITKNQFDFIDGTFGELYNSPSQIQNFPPSRLGLGRQTDGGDN